jgi:sugar phosphate isomerase/epimerase
MANMESLGQIPLAYASCSIGCRNEHTLPKKLAAISAAGFQAIELSMSDLVSFANQHLGRADPNEITGTSYDALCEAGTEVRRLCASQNLSILVLQPFENFEGWPKASPEYRDAWDRVNGWVRIMQAVGTDLLQVGSSDSPAEKIGTDRARFVEDLRDLADLLASKGFRVAYENWCWSTHAPEWKDVWDICQKVDRENFGLCLDTFQSAGGEWGDPRTSSGLREDAGRSKEQVLKDWEASCKSLAESIPKEKIFFLQISDAYRPKQPFEDKEIDGLRPRGRWSHDFRPLPFEGYLPVVDFTRAVLATGFRGWFSYEVFDGGPDGKGKDYELDDLAKSAMACQRRLMDACRAAA